MSSRPRVVRTSLLTPAMRAPLILASLLLFACGRSHPWDDDAGRPIDPRGDAMPPPPDAIPPSPDADMRPPPDGDVTPLPCTPTGRKVDLLFMIDNSNSMAEEQASLTAQFQNIVLTLASGDLEGDGVIDFAPVDNLHVGVVSSDMGSGGFTVPTCNEPTFGDDGILSRRGNPAIEGCMATYPQFLVFGPDADVSSYATRAACLATLGTGGCGFEQQLEAALKAVTPSTAPIAFSQGSIGHADNTNTGFIRPDSVLAIVLLTDEEDCSAADPGLFNPASPTYAGDLNLRCFMYPQAVHPIDRYVQGFLATRDNPADLVWIAITGVPTDLVANPALIDYYAILADPRMQERVDITSMTPRLVPSCNVPGRGVAFPPRRIVQTAQQLETYGATALVQSICQDDFRGAAGAIVSRLADRIGPGCVD